jgi:hypothetical protein
VSYSWRGGSELWTRRGDHHPRQLLILEPLFEEKNRTRRLIAQIMVALDQAEIGTILPDLPGTGESLTDISKVSIADWQDAVKAAVLQAKPGYVASFRGGALLDDQRLATWRFAPEDGARIARDLRRTQLASGSASPLYAGHALSDPFLGALEDLVPAPLPAPLPTVRTVRLARDIADADARYEGAPLWRRAEPGEDVGLAIALAQDLISWIATCAAC